MRLETLALHHGYSAEATTRAAAVPIYQTTSFTFRDTQHGADLFDLKEEGNIYSRIMNPTNAVLEQRLAAIEGGVGALAVASGMAAINYTIQTITAAGDNIVSISQLYGGTYNFFAHSLPQQGIWLIGQYNENSNCSFALCKSYRCSRTFFNCMW